MKQHFKSHINDVKRFLKEVNKIIDNDAFDYRTQFILIDRNDDMSNSIYNNKNTLLLLNYNVENIILELKKINN